LIDFLPAVHTGSKSLKPEFNPEAPKLAAVCSRIRSKPEVHVHDIIATEFSEDHRCSRRG
jgi:hypothetical protein